MMWDDYVYDKKEKKVRNYIQGDTERTDAIYLGRFLSWGEANDYFKECNIEK